MTNAASLQLSPTGLLPEELAAVLPLDKPFRAKQIFKWIAKGAKTFADMSDLPADMREKLGGITLCSSSIEKKLSGGDGSVKLRIRLKDGAAVEAVLLVDDHAASERRTACLSTQVGCQMACSFCKTGTLGFTRNLGADEIIEQYIHLSALGDKPSNIVFMGMGEPLLNLDALRKAIQILTHADGCAISKRKITVSTCGIVPGIRALADEGPHVRLAVSLTSADNELRSALMPVNNTWDTAALKEALVYYQAKTGDRLTIEAALMAGHNSSIYAARALARWVQPLKVQINVIAWNRIDGLPYQEPSLAELAAYIAELERRGLTVVQRAKRGRGVMAACGQLGGLTP